MCCSVDTRDYLCHDLSGIQRENHARNEKKNLKNTNFDVKMFTFLKKKKIQVYNINHNIFVDS